MLPLGLTSNLRSASLVSFRICALASWQSLQKGRASCSLGQWSISANYIPALFAFHNIFIPFIENLQFSGFWIFFITLHRKTIYFISWSQIPITYIFTSNKIAWVTLTKCILIFFVLFNSIFEYTTFSWIFQLQPTEMILRSENELWPRNRL